MSLFMSLLLVLIISTCVDAFRKKHRSHATSFIDDCGAEVRGARYRQSSWLRTQKCKCQAGYCLSGSDPACGDGTQRYFALGTLVGKNCSCAKEDLEEVVPATDRMVGLDFPWSPAQMYASMLLATKYVLLNYGEGYELELTMPRPGATSAVDFNLTLVAKRPRDAAFFTQKQFTIWKNDDPGDKTIYVIFKYMGANPKQPIDYMFLDTDVNEACAEQAIPGLRRIMWDEGIREEMPKMSCYIASMIDKMWSRSNLNFGKVLTEILLDNPEHRVLFTGYSLGAAQAMAAALRFRMLDLQSMSPELQKRLVWYPDGLHVLSQNGLKWTDASGAKVYQHYFGTRSLALHGSVKSWGEQIYDNAARYDTRLTEIQPTKLLDYETGHMLDCRADGDPPCPTSTDSKYEVWQTSGTTHLAINYLRKARFLGWPKFCKREGMTAC